MDEQSRNQEHEGHEETVIEQHDQIEAKPTHPVAIAEMGEVDGGMVDHHQQSDERARPVERHDASRHRGGLIALAGFSQHGFRSAYTSVTFRTRRKSAS